jgi:hypothetical protein
LHELLRQAETELQNTREAFAEEKRAFEQEVHHQLDQIEWHRQHLADKLADKDTQIAGLQHDKSSVIRKQNATMEMFLQSYARLQAQVHDIAAVATELAGQISLLGSDHEVRDRRMFHMPDYGASMMCNAENALLYRTSRSASSIHLWRFGSRWRHGKAMRTQPTAPLLTRYFCTWLAPTYLLLDVACEWGGCSSIGCMVLTENWRSNRKSFRRSQVNSRTRGRKYPPSRQQSSS